MTSVEDGATGGGDNPALGDDDDNPALGDDDPAAAYCLRSVRGDSLFINFRNKDTSSVVIDFKRFLFAPSTSLPWPGATLLCCCCC